MKRLLTLIAFIGLSVSLNAQITLPYLENFEGATADTMLGTISPVPGIPTLSYENGGTFGRLVTNSGIVGAGSRSLVMDVSSNGNYDYNYATLTLDMTNYTASTDYVVVSFMVGDGGDEYHPDDRVWVRGDNNASTPWIEIFDWEPAVPDNSMFYASQLPVSSALVANGQSFSSTFQIRFGQYDNFAFGTDGAMFDEVLFELINCPGVNSLTTSNPTTTSMDVSWVELGSATSWQIEYDTAGFALGNGTSAITSTSTFSISGLIANSTYNVYVRSICGAGDTSAWFGPFSFMTLCGSFSLPYSENFDGASTPSLPSCWLTNNSAEVYTTATCNGSSGNSLQINGVAGSYAYSPVIDASGVSSVTVQYDYREGDNAGCGNAAEAGDNINVDYWDGTTWVNIVNYDGAASPQTFTNNYWVINSGLTSSFRLRFQNQNGSGSGFDNFNFDNVTVYETPPCVQPSSLSSFNITYNSATLTWVENGTATQWQIEYGTIGFTPGTGTTTVVSNDTAIISGLNPSTPYDFYVQALCGGTDSSFWIGPITLTTDCAPFVAPFTESFNANSTPTCWTQSAATGGPWEFGQIGDAGFAAANADDHTGNGGFFTWVDFSQTDLNVVITSPIIDVSAISSPEFSFWLFSSNTDDATSYNDLIVEVYDGTSWSTLDSIQGELGSWTQFSYSIGAYTYGANFFQFRFRGESGGSFADFYNDLLIDDINVNSRPPNNLSTTSVDTITTLCALSSAEVIMINLFNAGSADQVNFDVSYSVNGGTVVTETVTDTLKVDSTMQYAFASTVDMSAQGSYNIVAYSELSGDADISNDTTMYNARNRNSPDPITTGADVCPAGSATISAVGNGLITWYDASAGGNIIGTGPNYTTPTINAFTTYYAQQTSFVNYQVGPDSSIGGGGQFGPFNQGLFFDALQDFYLDSLTLYADTTGMVEIVIESAVDTAYRAYINVNQGRNRLNIGANVPAGSYEIHVGDSATTALFRNNSGAVYPYSVAGIVDITSANNFVPGYYYFFYDWKVLILDCPSARVATEVTFCATGIANDVQQAVRIYPNPAKGIVNLELDDYKGNSLVEIISARGQISKSINVTSKLSTIDISDLSKGIYTVRVQNIEGIGIQKLVVE